MVARDIDTVPLARINSIVDNVMRSAVSVDEANRITTVRVKHVVDDQRAGVAAIDCNSAVARAAAIGKNAVELDVDILILIVAAE